MYKLGQLTIASQHEYRTTDLQKVGHIDTPPKREARQIAYACRSQDFGNEKGKN
jgi:hypothetical protein